MKGGHRKGLNIEDIPIDVQSIIKDLVYDTDKCIQTIYPQVKEGYGVLQRVVGKEGKRKRFRTHRVSQVIFNREIRDGEIVCHTCDNPACINPKHLWAGTDLDNQMDKVRKDRQAKGEKNGRYIDGRTSAPKPVPEFKTLFSRKLSKDEVVKIKYMILKGIPLPKISKEFNVKETVIRDISCGRTYKSVKVEGFNR